MEFKDYYKVLGVDPSADKKAIKSAYRKLASKYHPDVSGSSDTEEKFKEVVEAYEVLKNTERRAEYDELRQYGGQHGQGFKPPPGWHSSSEFEGDFSQQGYSDFFSEIFGGMGGGNRHGFQSGDFYDQRGQDIETDLPVFLEDTLSEGTKTFSLQVPTAQADGRIVQVSKTLKVTIPAGVLDGERIRLKGQGGEGMGSGLKGDLYLRVRLVPHPLFDVEAHNLIITVPISPWEAALGCKVQVPTLTGKINLSIPPNSQSGQRLRAKGKGLVQGDKRGDLYALLKVVMPATASDTVQNHWQALAKEAAFDPRAEWSKS